jgi:hypothetical protein
MRTAVDFRCRGWRGRVRSSDAPTAEAKSGRQRLDPRVRRGCALDRCRDRCPTAGWTSHVPLGRRRGRAAGASAPAWRACGAGPVKRSRDRARRTGDLRDAQHHPALDALGRLQAAHSAYRAGPIRPAARQSGSAAYVLDLRLRLAASPSCSAEPTDAKVGSTRGVYRLPPRHPHSRKAAGDRRRAARGPAATLPLCSHGTSVASCAQPLPRVTSTVRKGSPVRVRQRASFRNRATARFRCFLGRSRPLPWRGEGVAGWSPEKRVPSRTGGGASRPGGAPEPTRGWREPAVDRRAALDGPLDAVYRPSGAQAISRPPGLETLALCAG